MEGVVPTEFQPLVTRIETMLRQAAANWKIEECQDFNLGSYFDTEFSPVTEGSVSVSWTSADGLTRRIMYWLSISYSSRAPSIDGVKGLCSTGSMHDRREKETDFLYSFGERSQLDEVFAEISAWTDAELTRPQWLDYLEKFNSRST